MACESCNDLGFQAGAHTERVVPCPACKEEPTHQPFAPDAPIPGEHHYSACSDDRPTVAPDGVCRGCGETACPDCGYERCKCAGAVPADPGENPAYGKGNPDFDRDFERDV